MTLPIFAARVAQEWTGTGSGTSITLGVALTSYRSLHSARAVDDLVPYGIVHTTASTVEWEEGVGKVEAGGAFERTTVLQGSAGPGNRVSFSAGIKHFFIAPGEDFLNHLPARLDLSLITSSIPIGSSWDGTLPAGSLLALHRLATTDHLWIRLFATSADRAADTRTDHADPAPPELLHEALLYNTSQEELQVPPLLFANGDVPALRVLYVRITRLDSAGGLIPPDVVLMADALVEASQVNAIDHTVSNPGATGGTRFEHVDEGTDPGDWRVNPSGDPGGVYRHAMNAGEGSEVLRFNAAVRDDLFEIETDLYRASITSLVCSSGLVLLAPGTSIASWDGSGCLRVIVEGDNVDTDVPLLLQYVVSKGPLVTVDLANVNIGNFSISTGYNLIVRKDAWRIRAWWEGALEIDIDLAAESAMDPYRTALMAGSNRHLGCYGVQDNAAARITHTSFEVRDVAPGAGGAVITCDVRATRLAA